MAISQFPPSTEAPSSQAHAKRMVRIGWWIILIAIVPIGANRSAEVRAAAEQLHAELSALGIDALLDDRDERPGVMFADMDLIGIPHRVVIGERGLKTGNWVYSPLLSWSL